MGLANEGTAPRAGEAPSQLAFPEEDKTDTQGTSRRPRQKRPTKRELVLSWLMQEEAVCSTTCLERYVARAAAHVHTLRKQGFVIVTRPCSRPNHRHESYQIEYALQALPWEPR